MTATPIVMQLAKLLDVSEDAARALALAAGMHRAGLPPDEVAAGLAALLAQVPRAPSGPSH